MRSTLKSISDYSYSAVWEGIRAAYWTRLGNHRLAEHCRQLARESEQHLAQLQQQGGRR
jgi:UTP:GlnB (protein PII) uridylyltransferase